jgi:2'-hydroxyisoflavone reductase
VDRYVFISTISVYADNSKPNDETGALAKVRRRRCDEGNARHAHRVAVQTLRSAEGAVGTGSGEVVPGEDAGDSAGPHRWALATRRIGFTYWPVRIDRGGEVLAPGDPKDPVQFIDARDLAEWTIRMVEKRATGIYNATGPGDAARAWARCSMG